MKKISLLTFVTLVSLLIFNYFSTRHKNIENDFEYFYANCSIFSKDGKIIFNTWGYLCDYADDGKVLSSNTIKNYLALKDHNNQILWASAENAHHDLKFTADQKSFLLIHAEVINFRNQKVQSDCFSRRDLTNKILNKWCLSENIEALEKLGFQFEAKFIRHVNRIGNLFDIEYEISHSNSIYEIEQNSLSEKHPAFQKGNYLIHLFKPSYALLIIDRDMKKILWHKNLSQFKYGLDQLQFETHDNQVTPDGKILMYVNMTYIRDHFSLLNNNNYILKEKPFEMRDFNWNSSLVKYDPITEHLEWIFESDPIEKFKSGALGSVTILKNNNYLFSDITGNAAAYEVDQNRNIVWKFESPFISNATNKIAKAKPMYNISFLKARGIN